MKITVLGTGMVGKTIAQKLAELGHEIVIGTRDVAKTMTNTEPDRAGLPPVMDLIEGKKMTVRKFEEAALDSEAIFNCTGGLVSLEVLKAIGAENLDGKLLVDIANPLDFSQGMPPFLNPVNTTSLGEQIQSAYPKVRVVKTLNTMTASLMVNPRKLNSSHNVFVCGNYKSAKEVVNQLLVSFGWQPSEIIDLGDITNARGTEMLLPIWLRIWGAIETAEFNFSIVRNH